MKIDQQLLNQQQQHHQILPKQNPYFLWEQHNITLIKNSNYGYGIAISGGLCNNNQDSSIYISDIVPGGPAENKLMIDDIILSVNGVNVENVEHSFVIRLLKEAKDFIHLVLKRKVMQNPIQNQSSATNIQPNDFELNQKRHNIAIQQTAATVMSNYQNSYQTNGFNQVQANNNTNINNTNNNSENSTSSTNQMSLMMSSTHSISSLKPIKIQLNKKDKKEQFGLVLGCKYYIKDIIPNSLASNETNLKKGDILVKLNDFSPEQLSLIEANRILTKSKESKLNIVVKRNSLSSIEDESELINELPNNQNETNNLNTNLQQNKSNYLTLTQSSDATDASQQQTQPQQSTNNQLFRQNEIENNNRASKFFSNKSQVLNYRTIIFSRENGIGIRLAGGNKVGIFISDVQYNSPAERAGIRIADKVIRVNGVDYTCLTREEAVQNILNLQNIIEMVVAHSPEEYEANALDPLGCDSFYIRTHFSLSSKNPDSLEFKINDILHVTDTLHNGVIGKWVASKLDRSEQGGEDLRGTIPNQLNAEQLVQTAPTIEQLYTTNSKEANENGSSSGFSLGASARMSIRMKLAGKNSLAKRSKSASRATNDSDSNQALKISKTNTFYSNKYPAYERVVLKEVNFLRPIVIFGPLADVAREKLKSEFPGKYEIPESYSTDPNDPNSQATGVIKLASIKSIIEKGHHCLLDITPNAVDHLNYAQYFPICIYLKAQSRAHTKDLRQKYAKNLKAKSSKRLFDNALKLQNYYSHLFTGIIQLDSNQWFKKLKETIEQQQTQPVWISQDLDSLITKQQNEQLQSNQAQMDLNLQQQQFINKQNQLINNSEIIQQSTNNNSRYLFDDNFEFPLYTAANPTFSMSGAASSTYSLYEENNDYNRCSFAASDSDICGSIQNPKTINSLSTNLQASNEPTIPIYSTNFNKASNQIQNDQFNSPSNLTRVKSDPSLAVAQQELYSKVQPKNYDIDQINNKNFNNNNNTNSTNQQYQYQLQSNDEKWKKFATYSSNSFNKLNESNSASPIKSSNTTPIKNRPCLNEQNFTNYQLEKQVNDQFRRLSTTDFNEQLNQQQNSMRNSASYSSYKLIKNSQSPLMPSTNKSIIDQPLNLNNNGNQENVSLLKPILSNDHLDNSKLNKQQLYKQELTSKLNEIERPNSMSTNNINNSNNNSMKNSDLMTLRRKKESPSRPPPPTLPKPKFILPQTSTTNLILQRNLKSKSELNIATPSNFSSSSAACSSSSSSSSSSSGNEIHIDNETKLLTNPNIPQQPLRNKFLENNSIISSSQGYQSDTWESHSSRQSFEMDSQLISNSRYAKNLVKTTKQINESKLAKKTILTNNLEVNNMSDGSLNGIVSGSDDTDSIPNENQNQFYNHHLNQKNGIIQKPTSSSSTSSTLSTSSSASSSGVGLGNSNELKRLSTIVNNDSVELPIYYQPTNEAMNTSGNSLNKTTNNNNSFYNQQQIQQQQQLNNNSNKYSDLYSNDSVKYRTTTYTAHYNDNGVYRQLSLDSNSNCSIIASANGIFDSNGGILESADTGVSLNVPEGAIASGCSFDLYFKVCHCKTSISNGKGELLSNPIVMCGPRGIKFLKPIELQIPHFISIDGQSWSYAFKTHESISEDDDPYNWNVNRFHKKTLINSVTVQLESF